MADFRPMNFGQDFHITIYDTIKVIKMENKDKEIAKDLNFLMGTHLDLFDTMYGNTTRKEMIAKSEKRICKKALSYFERDSLPIKKCIEFCKRWVEKELADRKGVINKRKNDGDKLKVKHTNKNGESEIEGSLAFYDVVTSIANIDAEIEIPIFQRILEEIEITSEIPENRINRGNFIRRIIDVICISETMIIPNEFELFRKTEMNLISSQCIDTFLTDNPDYQKNVFVIMSFTNTPEINSIWKSINTSLQKHNFKALRADLKTYGQSRQIWENLTTYMNGCNYGIAVLENYSSKEFNPNIALEYGYMRALGKQVLLLKENHFDNIRADLLGTIWISFSIFDVETTIDNAIERWVNDLS